MEEASAAGEALGAADEEKIDEVALLGELRAVGGTHDVRETDEETPLEDDEEGGGEENDDVVVKVAFFFRGLGAVPEVVMIISFRDSCSEEPSLVRRCTNFSEAPEHAKVGGED